MSLEGLLADMVWGFDHLRAVEKSQAAGCTTVSSYKKVSNDLQLLGHRFYDPNFGQKLRRSPVPARVSLRSACQGRRS